MYRAAIPIIALALLTACEDTGATPDAGVRDGAGADTSRDSSSVSRDAATGPDLSTATTVTGVAASYTLAAGNTLAHGLALDPKASPRRLYVADSADHKIYVYGVGPKALTLRAAESFSTTALHKELTAPRGLAFAREAGKRLLFVVTSADADKDKVWRSYLWRVDLDGETASRVALDQPTLGMAGAEAFGAAYNDGRVLVSYDTSRLKGADQVRRGILRLRVQQGASLDNWWTRAQAGDKAAAEAHLPHSGRLVTSGGYPRAPSFGLAVGAVEGCPIIWGTSYHKYLYAANGETGRGLFHWWSPGQRLIYGLAFGDGHLWAVDRVSGPDRVYKIRTHGAWTTPVVGPRHVRHLRMEITSTANTSVSSAGATHNFARPHAATTRPGQGYDAKGVEVTTSGATATATVASYVPAGDVASTQRYDSVTYQGAVSAGAKLRTLVDLDFWTASRRVHVYPHRVDALAAPPAGYTADCDAVYKMSDKAAYDAFWGAVQKATAVEYGAAMAGDKSPYWRARNIMEFILERHDYGNVSDFSKGHYGYNPANLKLRLALDAHAGNEKMSCSTSTFAMSGVLRYLGVPTRWIGTTKRRGGWDANKDGFLGAGEGAVDTSFHRWPEVWLGKLYGWQRFDPTPPGDGPRQLSQYELMAKSAQGVGWTDLVLQVGSGKHAPFLRQADCNQRYNSVPRYADHKAWLDTRYRYIVWGAACLLSVTAPAGGKVTAGATTVTWKATGRWDLDPGATLSLYRRPMKLSGGKMVSAGDLVLVAARVPVKAGSHKVSLSGLKKGTHHRLELRKNGDSETGALGQVFTYSP